MDHRRGRGVPITFEQSIATYRLDFALQGMAVLALSALLLLAGPQDEPLRLVAFLLLGLASWTAIEYGMHRFVFHGVQPFRRWHEEHHRRPAALIGTPALLIALGIGGLVFLPVLLLADLWTSCSLTLGVLTGYLVYGIVHHAVHHWRCRNAWLRNCRRLHALHHRAGSTGNFGVTSVFWDCVFGTRNEGRP
jgi:sterol desaturase/sphingolipid hydroxylase (fatty acid hydroxylase superfamily)